MPLARCQAVADTRHKIWIIEITFDLHHKLHNKQKRTEMWAIDFLLKF